MSNYPDWVNAYKQKGTSVKKVGNAYYLYRSTSKRVPGKKYPQPIQEYVGRISEDGLIRTQIRKVSTDRVKVYEYGLSYAMQALLPDTFLIGTHDRQTMRLVFLHMIKHFSPGSYLLRDMVLPEAEDLHVNLSLQIRRYERMTGVSIQQLMPLSRMYLVETKQCDMLSEPTPQMREIFTGLGVELDGI